MVQRLHQILTEATTGRFCMIDWADTYIQQSSLDDNYDALVKKTTGNP